MSANFKILANTENRVNREIRQTRERCVLRRAGLDFSRVSRVSRFKESLRSLLKYPAQRRVGARGLHDSLGNHGSCRPGALTGRVFQQAVREKKSSSSAFILVRRSSSLRSEGGCVICGQRPFLVLSFILHSLSSVASAKEDAFFILHFPSAVQFPALPLAARRVLSSTMGQSSCASI